MAALIPIITIDGTSGTGKGTIAQLLAHHLQWRYLDSGVLYRVVAWAINYHDVDMANLHWLKEFIEKLPIELKTEQGRLSHVFCEGMDVTSKIRSEACGMHASKISAIPLVRTALLERQRAFGQLPGLVTDGRDMGTVIFPEAQLKIFLTASLEARTHRRYNQLKEKGIHVSLRDVQSELAQRDYQDTHRAVAPLKPASDAIVVDTTEQSIDDVFNLCLRKASQLFEL